jgi:hypothetical protein
MVHGCWNNLLARQVPSLPTLPLYALRLWDTGPIAMPKGKLIPFVYEKF